MDRWDALVAYDLPQENDPIVSKDDSWAALYPESMKPVKDWEELHKDKHSIEFLNRVAAWCSSKFVVMIDDIIFTRSISEIVFVAVRDLLKDGTLMMDLVIPNRRNSSYPLHKLFDPKNFNKDDLRKYDGSLLLGMNPSPDELISVSFKHGYSLSRDPVGLPFSWRFAIMDAQVINLRNQLRIIFGKPRPDMSRKVKLEIGPVDLVYAKVGYDPSLFGYPLFSARNILSNLYGQESITLYTDAVKMLLDSIHHILLNQLWDQGWPVVANWDGGLSHRCVIETPDKQDIKRMVRDALFDYFHDPAYTRPSLG